MFLFLMLEVFEKVVLTLCHDNIYLLDKVKFELLIVKLIGCFSKICFQVFLPLLGFELSFNFPLYIFILSRVSALETLLDTLAIIIINHSLALFV